MLYTHTYGNHLLARGWKLKDVFYNALTIKTMYELNKRYGWSKFIIVVPSVAIHEGVYKSFQMTEDHFAEDYGKRSATLFTTLPS